MLEVSLPKVKPEYLTEFLFSDLDFIQSNSMGRLQVFYANVD